MPNLSDPISLGPISLPNRIVAAPSPNVGAAGSGAVSTALTAVRCSGRGAAGLVITEPSPISPLARADAASTGIYARSEIDHWRRTAQAARDAGTRMILQLGHAGRLSHPRLLDGRRPVAPSAVAARSKIWVDETAKGGEGAMLRCPLPRALAEEDIQAIVADYRRAAENALEAGFDGVEINAANGFLIDQFLRRSSNKRSDRYGGSAENRIRFLLEVAEAVASAAGLERTGVRLSPFICERGMRDEEIGPTVLRAVEELDRMGIAFIHIVEPEPESGQGSPEYVRRSLRRAFSGRILMAGGYDRDRAHGVLWDGHADAVAFERPFAIVSETDEPQPDEVCSIPDAAVFALAADGAASASHVLLDD